MNQRCTQFKIIYKIDSIEQIICFKVIVLLVQLFKLFSHIQFVFLKTQQQLLFIIYLLYSSKFTLQCHYQLNFDSILYLSLHFSLLDRNFIYQLLQFLLHCLAFIVYFSLLQIQLLLQKHSKIQIVFLLARQLGTTNSRVAAIVMLHWLFSIRANV